MTIGASITKKYRAISSRLDEHTRRLWAATEVNALGRGGATLVSRATGISMRAILVGQKEILSGDIRPAGRVRRTGGGRKSLTENHPELLTQLENLVHPLTRGDPMSPLRWTCKSTTRLATELTALGFPISNHSVGSLLHHIGYSLQCNFKTVEGKCHPDRNAQFEFINALVASELKNNNAVISVDTKKCEKLGNFKNNGAEYEQKGEPTKVSGHDFPDPEIPRAHPFGIYDIKLNHGFVNVGTTHDTGSFAVASIRAWWKHKGRHQYKRARRILITADAGGSNGHRLRLWKWELQKLADEIHLPVSVCHFPPGTSKWNKVEHRLFSFITQNWRGRPLLDYTTVVNLISNTTTSKGLQVTCHLDLNEYLVGVKITDKQYSTIVVSRNVFHGDWNYTINPR